MKINISVTSSSVMYEIAIYVISTVMCIIRCRLIQFKPGVIHPNVCLCHFQLVLDRVFALYLYFRNFPAIRLREFDILLGNTFNPAYTADFSKYSSCKFVSAAQGPVEKTYACDRIVTGRFLAIYLKRAEYLQLCEVQVFGTTGKGHSNSH